MWCTNDAEYAAAKAASLHPDRFPDEDAWGVFIPSYPLLICPHCGYRVFEGVDDAAGHLAELCHTLFIKKKVVSDTKWGHVEEWVVARGAMGLTLEQAIRAACTLIKEPQD